MISTTYAPRPSRSNWARVIYNVLHDNGKAMSRDKIWETIPTSMHTPHSKGKFTAALSNMVYNGYLKSYDQVGKRQKAYRIDTRVNYDARRAEVKASKVKSKAKKVKKASAKRFVTSAGTVPLVAMIDSELEKISQAMDELKDRRATLKAMRKDAATL